MRARLRAHVAANFGNFRWSSRAEAELPSESLRQPDGLRRRRQDRRHAIHSRDGYTLREPAASIMAKQTTFVLSLSQGGFAVTRDKPDV